METYSVRMAEEFAKRCDFECIALPGRKDGRAPSAVSLIAFGLLSALRTPFRRKVEVAHMGDMAIWPLGWLEMLLGRTDWLVLSAHGSDVSLIERKGIATQLYRAYLKLAALLIPDARVIANSAFTAGLARSVGFAHISVVPLGTDLHLIEQPERSGLLFAGRVSRDKGLRFLIEQVLPKLRTSMKLRVAGPIWDESEQDLLDNPAVEYLGPLTPEQLQVEYSRTQITLVPSQVAEGFGLVAIEAAACGSQVIASRSGGLLDVVREPWGELVDPRDAVAWARAIDERCSADREAWDNRRQAALQDVEQNYRWAEVADRTLDQFR
jgi:glycosyltransferase involved in cell wall biosynthesis